MGKEILTRKYGQKSIIAKEFCVSNACVTKALHFRNNSALCKAIRTRALELGGILVN